MRQVEKQQRLRKIIPVPQVVRCYFDKNPISYDMEFIQGLDFRQACLSKPMSWINVFVECMCTHFKALEGAAVKADLQSAFKSKLVSLQDVLYAHQAGKVRALIPVLEALLAYDFSRLPATASHGDLTLENIIFKGDGDVVFIDVLDGDLESFWMDIAKITYDLEIAWSLRSSLWQSDHSPDDRLLRMLSRYLSEELGMVIAQKFPEAVPHLPALKAIQALRVLPYSHNEQTIDKLASYVAKLPIPV
ncbi:hypothetical protein BJF93_12570 [Xaviernesmea oryzae]|uniref:Aminoglycoside phosphotransferase domain-containing protein n=2 Tax=Xaviernesmea oryzae TaxID=464029 RepID=A0A1Q9B3J9_9HYPH|nr:hypothetical protein BJF93_12570 [Xaviernesmea oryzae]SEM25369.1 hypothetical protein SAMN04487976_1253 [Xaviernesmea oryzae]